MSCQTVGWAQIKVKVIANVQLGYEIATTKALTISQDSTSNKNNNYISQYIHMCTADYKSSSLSISKT